MYGYLENKGLVATVVPGVGLCYKDKDVSSGTTGFKLVSVIKTKMSVPAPQGLSWSRLLRTLTCL